MCFLFIFKLTYFSFFFIFLFDYDCVRVGKSFYFLKVDDTLSIGSFV